MSLKSELIDYIYIKLGIQLHQVFVTEEQIEEIIKETIEYFQENSTMTTQEVFLYVAFVTGQTEYTMPSNLRTITQILPAGNALDIFSVERHIVDNSIFNSMYRNTSGYSLLDVYLTRQWIQQARNLLTKSIMYKYSEMDNILKLNSPPSSEASGMVVQGYASLYDEEDDDSKLYSFPWVKKYALALAWITLGTNLKLYSGTPLPAGMTFDADFALSQGESMKEKMETELDEKYNEPARFVIG